MKPTSFSLLMVLGTSFIIKIIKEQGFLRKSHQKTYPLDPGSEIRDPEKFIPDPGGKKAPDPDPQHCFSLIVLVRPSVADPGSGAFLPPGSGIRDEFFPDPRSGSGMSYRYLFDFVDFVLKP
jgi:hypothetical protein